MSVPSRVTSELDALFSKDSTVPKSAFSAEDSCSAEFPRIVSPLNLLEESDDESTWCGPSSEPESSGKPDILAMKAWSIEQGHGKQDCEGDSAPAPIAATIASPSSGNARHDANIFSDRLAALPLDHSIQEPRRAQTWHKKSTHLIQPQGAIEGQNNKYVCAFQIGLEDDDEFCLVKRILGKNGCNMKRIAEECNAKLRLRGIGSGFLEGSAGGTEANMPLNLNVSCCDFDSYKGAVDRVATLLKDLYKHHRRYSRANGLQPLDVKISLEEVRRDDLGFDALKQKSNDRQTRRFQREKFHEREEKHAEVVEADNLGSSRSNNLTGIDVGSEGSELINLPGWALVPAAPAGYRLVAKRGGAERAASMSEEADTMDRVVCENEAQMREERKQKAAERAAIVASRISRHANTSSKPKSHVVAKPGVRHTDNENTPPILGTNASAARGRAIACNLGIENCDPWAETAVTCDIGVDRKEGAEDPWTDFTILQAASATGRKHKTYLI